jgi:hypothetical protein
MPAFVDKANYIQRVIGDFVIDKIGKRAAAAAGKPLGADMIAAFSFDDGANCFLDAIMKIPALMRRDHAVLCLNY